MTDKERIRAEIERLYNENKERHSIEGIAASTQLHKVLFFIDSMQEDPVSEDMDKAAFQAYLEAEDKESYTDTYIDGFKAGAKWDRQILTKNAVKGIVHHFGDDEIAAIHYNDPKGVPMSYFVSSNDLKAGDNVKLITIKEE